MFVSAIVREILHRGECTYDIGGVVVVFATSVHQEVKLSLCRSIVSDIVQRSSSSSSRRNRIIRHLLTPMRKASLHERSLKLLLILSSLGLGKDSTVANARDVVCLSQHSNLVLILDDTGYFDSVLEDLKVLVIEADEGDVVGDLVRDGKGGGLGVFGTEVGEGCVEFGGELNFIHIVLREGLVDADGETRPDYIVGVDGGDEED